ncbi:hypothetical protein [Mycolicibacterium iranicum]|uniref:Diacylglycerol O-acyltransferase n=1 Tax=Mycolicibacterium iranicum TaxID=912594 RepID=A0A178LG53_MYCIR|nr:hypothetical protein [Mycolicibacterium iranicum]OAN28592.1 hypothetical protein A4X20_10355 [Mycolicibacterium iranicum]
MREDRLAYIDQATFLSLRATGQAQVVQLVWVYEHPLDHVGLKRFHENFGYGLAGRRIERSPLPFGRHRWISSTGPAGDLDVAEEPRPRADLSDWIDERSQVPVDPENGPGWHLGVLPMTDGSTAVTLVASHCLMDGLGLAQTLVEAITGSVREFGYPAANARTRRQALALDAREALRGISAAARAIVAAVRLSRRRRDETLPKPERRRVGHADEVVVVPAVSVVVDIDDWDRSAKVLGGNSHSLFAGFSAGLARRIGRCRADGTVDLVLALSDRTWEDTRANALRFAGVNVDPVRAVGDLSDARGDIRTAVAALRDNPDETFALQPLTPFIPKRAVRGFGAAVFGALPVSCSSVGELPELGFQIDGTVAEHGYLRAVDQNVRRCQIDRSGGQLVLVAGRVGGKMNIGVTAYQPGADNTKPRLRALAADVLAEFGITGEIL